MSEDIQQTIKKQIEDNNIILYMKGNKQFPQCGFSAQVVHIMNSYGVPYETVDVLLDPEIRQGIKDYSNWPTIPQLYVKGEFIGGCDICTEMYQNGELEQIVKSAAE
ncbi:MAG: Grx4 family monothiol glutaredoxin [Candidatus Dadabacteria bacterium]|nr:Grx4 family monothiol glutaredoxin [Candidatus Dadabacteria bacterium]